MTDVTDPCASPPFDGTLADVLIDRAARHPDRVLLSVDGQPITTAEIAVAAEAFSRGLSARGVKPGDRVLTMLDAGPTYVALYLGVSLLGATWVPQAPEAKGPSLAHVLAISRPALVIAAPRSVANLAAAGFDEPGAIWQLDAWDWAGNPAGQPAPQRPTPTPHRAVDLGPDDVRAVLFTSGTTGPPKGVCVTDRMMLASAAGCAFASACRAGDIFVMWEPMHHIGGPQLLIMALIHGARLEMVKRFSASGFWPLVRGRGVTKLHYLGGILEILLKAEPRADDRDHPIQLAFGGGCRPEIRRAFQARFGIPIREVFGMTEASSFTTVDDRGTEASIGQVLPWMEVKLVRDDGARAPVGDQGEICVRPRFPGLLTPGYLQDSEATQRLLQDGWLFTGDLGRRDAAGNYYFLGRKTDSLRRRGENISAWEVEAALAAHPDIAETAIVGVPADIGESDILCFVLMRAGCAFDPGKTLDWCHDNMPRHHVPRYWKPVTEFERTPSQRIKKDRLDKTVHDAIDLGQGGGSGGA